VPITGNPLGRTGRMLTVAVSAEMVYQLVGANLSSPQTNELNAGARAPTLQKWVNVTNLEAAGWIGFLIILDGSLWPLVGGGLALAGMMIKYRYAINAGVNSPAAPTEAYG
jgi:hypothetical protein